MQQLPQHQQLNSRRRRRHRSTSSNCCQLKVTFLFCYLPRRRPVPSTGSPLRGLPPRWSRHSSGRRWSHRRAKVRRLARPTSRRMSSRYKFQALYVHLHRVYTACIRRTRRLTRWLHAYHELYCTYYTVDISTTGLLHEHYELHLAPGQRHRTRDRHAPRLSEIERDRIRGQGGRGARGGRRAE